MMLHHTAGVECEACDEKLLQAHPFMRSWFKNKVKAKYVNCHISWSWRGKSDQNKFYADGKTKAMWPNSPHNQVVDEKPCSYALDLFQIDEDGIARFSQLFYARINAENETARLPVRWGGKFKSIGDADHFEYKEALDPAA
jgi:hypothetical protein